MTKKRVSVVATIAVVGVFALANVNFYRQESALVTHIIGRPEDTYPVTSFPPGNQPLVRLAAVGDVGTASSEEDEVAAAMLDVARSDWYDALVLLGDNVYPEGEAARLDDTVYRPFGPLLADGTQLLAVLGNHDVLAADGGAEQIARLGMDGNWWSVVIDDVLIVGLDSNQPNSLEQLAWLEATLASAQSKWRVAVLHHAPYSAGYQGSTVAVRDAFVPVFERYGVQLVLAGHDHDYQRSMPISGVTYLVSGGGAEFRRTGTEEFTAYSAATFHFLDVNVFDDRIYVQAIDSDGRRFDEVSILP